MRFIRSTTCRLIAIGIATFMTTVPALAAPTGTLLDVASGQKNLTMFVSAVKTAGLTDELSGTDQYTVFAPTDEFFAQMPQDRRDALMSDPARLRVWLQNFIVADRVRIHSNNGDLSNGDLPTVGGRTLVVLTNANYDLTVGGARVVTADLNATNGLLDEIDHGPMP